MIGDPAGSPAYAAPMADKAELGKLLIFGAVVVVVLTLIFHSWKQSEYEADRDVDAYVEALGGTPTGEDAGFDSTPYYVLGGGGGALLFLSGVILYATNSDDERSPDA